MIRSPVQLVLASNSPRRKDILEILGYPFRVVRPLARENIGIASGSLSDVTLLLAEAKANQAASLCQDAIIVAADTLVALDGEILAKPSDPEDARKMLLRLRGRTHSVSTSVAVLNTLSSSSESTSVISLVTMRSYSEDEVERYIASGAPADKAGAYGIQDSFFSPVASVQGCYLNVVGLPLCALTRILPKHGLTPRSTWSGIVQDKCTACRSWQSQGKR